MKVNQNFEFAEPIVSLQNKKPFRRRMTYLKPGELEEFKCLLLDFRDRIISQAYNNQSSAGPLNGKRMMIKEIDDALKRIEARTYGVCEATNRTISKTLLRGMPWARYCYND